MTDKPISKKTRLLLRNTAYPTTAELQPFINGHMKIDAANSNEKSAVDLPAMSSLIPVNAENLRISKEYRKQLPSLMKGKLELMQNFMLHEIAPTLLAVANGLQDSKEILEATFEEATDTNGVFARIEDAVSRALDVKIMNFVIGVTGLEPKEVAEFKLLSLSKEMGSNENLVGQLFAMLKVHDLPRAKKERKAPVRGLQEAEGPGPRGRAGRPGARTKR